MQVGHLTHGGPSQPVLAKWFNAVQYGLDLAPARSTRSGSRRSAHEPKPRIIIAGAQAYFAPLDFGRFRAIADAVGRHPLGRHGAFWPAWWPVARTEPFPPLPMVATSTTSTDLCAAARSAIVLMQ